MTTDLINNTIDFLNRLPPWVDRLGSILGIILFIFTLLKFGKSFIQSIIKILDWVSALSKTTAANRAKKIAIDLHVWMECYTDSRSFIVYIVTTLFEAQVSAIAIFAGIFLGIGLGAVLSPSQSFDISHHHILLILGIACVIVFIVLGRYFIDLAYMIDRDIYVTRMLGRLNRFLIRSGLNIKKDRELWLEKEGLLKIWKEREIAINEPEKERSLISRFIRR